jgi:hypothetical protein
VARGYDYFEVRTMDYLGLVLPLVLGVSAGLFILTQNKVGRPH